MILLWNLGQNKNLGVIFDSKLTFEPHVLNTVNTYFFYLRNIVRLRPMLSFPVAEKLMNTFVFSRIDYCIALLAGVSKATLNKLQVMQYSKTRIGESLHWLPLRFRVDLKILMLTYKALHALTPQYLSELLIPYTRGGAFVRLTLGW